MLDVAEANWKRIKMIDLLEAIEVEFYVDSTGKVWLNVDGKCAVRIGRAEKIVTRDDRQHFDA